jgi:hypothetical protein
LHGIFFSNLHDNILKRCSAAAPQHVIEWITLTLTRKRIKADEAPLRSTR